MMFSCKIVLAYQPKIDGMSQVYLQAIIGGQRAAVSLGFYVRAQDFSEKRQRIKISSHPNAETLNTELLAAIAKANDIASKFRLKNIVITPELFRNEFRDPTEANCFIKFMESERELKRPQIANNTYRQHGTVINKLKDFKRTILFNHITVELIQKFKNWLIKSGNKRSTVNKILKIVKQYLDDARKKGNGCKDPFAVIKIKNFKASRLSLSQIEVDKLDRYYNSVECPAHHRKLLRYFLFSCYTGIRISDISVITWNNVHDDLLVFIPVKTKYNQQSVVIPLRPVDKKYLPDFKPGNGPIFDTFAPAVTNRYLKEVAIDLDIRKHLTYHTSRHTFGSLFAEGGNIVALQKLMGHGDIRTTMGYVHTNVRNLIDAKTQRFG